MTMKKIIASALIFSLILTIVSTVSAVSKADTDFDIYFSSKVDLVSSTNRIFSVTYELTQNQKGVVGAGFDLEFDQSIVEVVKVENFYDVFTEFDSYLDFTDVNNDGCLKIRAFQKEFGYIATEQSGKLVTVQFKLKSDVLDSEIINITPQIIDTENYLIDDEVNQVTLTAGVESVSFKFTEIIPEFEPTTTVTTTEPATEPTTTLPHPDLSQDDEYELAFSATPYLIDQQERTFKVVYNMFMNTNKAVGAEFELKFDNTVCELQKIEAYTTLFTENTGFKKVEEINQTGSICYCGLQKNYGDYVKETYGDVLTVYFKLKDSADADKPIKITPVIVESGNYSIDYLADIPTQIYLKTYVEEVSFTVGTLKTEPTTTTTTTTTTTAATTTSSRATSEEVTTTTVATEAPTTTTLGNTNSTQSTSTTEKTTDEPSESVTGTASATTTANPTENQSTTTTVKVQKGDANGDGKISVADARKLVVAIAKGDTEALLEFGDVNGDGKISVADARKIIVAIAKNEFDF